MTIIKFGPDTDASTRRSVALYGLRGFIVDTYLRSPDQRIYGPRGIVKGATTEGLSMVEWTQDANWESCDPIMVLWDDITEVMVP